MIHTLIQGLYCLPILMLPLAAQHTNRLTLEQSTDLQAWQTVPMTPAMLDANGKILVHSATPERFYRIQIELLTPAGIATQPASTSITSGQTTTLSVTASGTGPFTYQWYEGSLGTTATPVGTNSASFTTPALAATTSYWVWVSNDAGNVNSSAATVTVTGGNVPSPEEFALISAGNFQMGDNFDEGSTDELPVHTVNLSAFYMGK